MTSDILKGIFLPIGLPPAYWNTRLPKASLFDLVSLVAGGNTADSVTTTPAGNLSSTNVQDALEELQADIDLLSSGTIPTFTKVFGGVTTDTILSAEHGLSTIHNVVVKTPTDTEVSVVVNIAGTTVIITSNISLLNHKLLIY